MKPDVTIIVPVINRRYADWLADLAQAVRGMNGCIELILVNQTGESLTMSGSGVFDFIQDKSPAWKARNIGAMNAHGHHLMFLDDDSCFFPADRSSVESALMNLIKITKIEANRDVTFAALKGYVENGKFRTYTDKSKRRPREIGLKDFPEYTVEWNMVIPLFIFNTLGGFPSIGTGSNHMAQSGEAFYFAGRIIIAGYSIRILPSVKITHPHMLKGIPKEKWLTYQYGKGFALGMLLAHLPGLWKLYWTARVTVGALLDSIGARDSKPRHIRKSHSFYLVLKGIWDGACKGEAETNRQFAQMRWID